MTDEEFTPLFAEPCDLTAAELEASTFGGWDFVFYAPPDADGGLRAWTYDGAGAVRRRPSRDLRRVTPAAVLHRAAGPPLGRQA